MQEDDIKSVLEMDQSWVSNEIKDQPSKPLLHNITNEITLGKQRIPHILVTILIRIIRIQRTFQQQNSVLGD